MDRYTVRIGDDAYIVEIDGDQIWIDGQQVYMGIHFLNDEGLFMVEQESGKREFHIKPQADGTYRVSTRGVQVEAIVESGREGSHQPAEKKDAGLISAPIPGVVMNVLVHTGDAVEQNQVLVVLESMKMLMDFRSPFPGRVENVAVAKGQKVEKGDRLVQLVKSAP